MQIIPAIKTQTEAGEVISPATILPQGILTKFDGENYIIYEAGDELPEQSMQSIYEIDTQKQEILNQIITLEEAITERRKNEAIIGVQESIDFIKGVLSEIKALREQLNANNSST